MDGDIIDVKTHNSTSYLVTERGEIYVFGACGHYMCGPGIIDNVSKPTKMNLDFLVTRLYVGYGSLFMHADDDEVYAIGNNQYS